MTRDEAVKAGHAAINEKFESSTLHRQPSSEGNVASNGSGLTCCGKMHHWKDLGVNVEGVEWSWSCPKCQSKLRVDRYMPQTDVPRPRNLFLLRTEVLG